MTIIPFTNYVTMSHDCHNHIIKSFTKIVLSHIRVIDCGPQVLVDIVNDIRQERHTRVTNCV